MKRNLLIAILATASITAALATEAVPFSVIKEKTDAVFYSEISKMSVPRSEQSKLAGFNLGETFTDKGDGYYTNATGTRCSTAEADSKSDPEPIAEMSRAGHVYCKVPMFGKTIEVDLALLRTVPKEPTFIVGNISFILANPDEETLAAFKEAITHRWGSASGTTEGNKNAPKKADEICNIPTRTVTARIQRDKCLASLDTNPFTSALNGPVHEGTTQFGKNGVQAYMIVSSISFMRVNATAYRFMIQSDAFEKAASKVGATYEKLKAQNEKAERESMTRNF